MKFTLGQAAKQVNVSKSTISRAVKEGRLSAEKKDDGSYLIDASELFRVYSPQVVNNRIATVDEVEITTGVDGLRKELEAALKRIADKDIHIEDLKNQVNDTQKDRDHWRHQATYLLEDKQQKEMLQSAGKEVQAKLEKVRSSWVGRLLFNV